MLSCYRKPFIWAKHQLFSSPVNCLITAVMLYVIYAITLPIIRWAFIDATWIGDNASACIETTGACWVFIKVRFTQFIYGFYPSESYWRVNLTGALAVVLLLLYSVKAVPKAYLTFIIVVGYPLIAIVLLHGGIFGLTVVSTSQWSGLFLTLVLACGGIVAAFPLGILLALGRRSNMPVIKAICVIFIEAVRGVPLISVLFMASVMFPLFMPDYITIDNLLRAFIGITLFQAAYMAEVIRGGLEAVPKGQYEGARSIGLGYWAMMALVVLPQALKIVIPGLVNTTIGLFKDTTLVLIIGLFDFLGIVQAATTDPQWLGMTLEGYVFCAVIYWVFCFCMSSYSQRLEKRGAGANRV